MASPKGFSKADMAIIKAAAKRLNDGKRVTAMEHDLLDRWQAYQDSQKASEGQSEGSGPSPWMVCTTDLAELVGVTMKTIAEWTKLGMPKESYGVYDFRKVFPWWLENINKGPEDKDQTITEAKRRYWLSKAEQTETKTATLKGELVKILDVVNYIGDRVSLFRNAVRSWRTRLPPKLVGKTQEEMLPVIEMEMDDALANISTDFNRLATENGGKVCRKPKRKNQPKKETPARSRKSKPKP